MDVHVRRLRAKLGSEYESMIGTVRQVGYKFVIPPAGAPTDRLGRAARPPRPALPADVVRDARPQRSSARPLGGHRYRSPDVRDSGCVGRTPTT